MIKKLPDLHYSRISSRSNKVLLYCQDLERSLTPSNSHTNTMYALLTKHNVVVVRERGNQMGHCCGLASAVVVFI